MKQSIFMLLSAALFLACEPRIELDKGQWGDTAFLTNVQIFKLDINDKAQLAEWNNSQQYVTGVRSIVVSNGNAVVKKEDFTATVVLKKGELLESAGFLFYHYGTLIEPLDGAPRAGIAGKLSLDRSYKYRVYSAERTYHDWTITIVPQ